MDDYRFADYIGYRETVGEAHAYRVTARSEQRREVTRVVRMCAAVWVIVTERVRKRIVGVTRARAAVMDVEAEEVVFTVVFTVRQSRDVGADEYAARSLTKYYCAVYIGVSSTARNVSTRCPCYIRSIHNNHHVFARQRFPFLFDAVYAQRRKHVSAELAMIKISSGKHSSPLQQNITLYDFRRFPVRGKRNIEMQFVLL